MKNFQAIRPCVPQPVRGAGLLMLGTASNRLRHHTIFVHNAAWISDMARQTTMVRQCQQMADHHPQPWQIEDEGKGFFKAFEVVGNQLILA